MLAKDLTVVCNAVGFDAFLGYFHQPRFGRASLALDLMEPFRPLIADSAVLSAINTRMVTTKDFIRVGPAVALKPEGRKGSSAPTSSGWIPWSRIRSLGIV